CAHQDRARLRRDRSAERRRIDRPARRARGHEHGRQAEAQATAARSGAIPSGAVYATLLATMASHAALATGGGVGRSQMPWPRLMAPGIASQARLIERISEITRFATRAPSFIPRTVFRVPRANATSTPHRGVATRPHFVCCASGFAS